MSGTQSAAAASPSTEAVETPVSVPPTSRLAHTKDKKAAKSVSSVTTTSKMGSGNCDLVKSGSGGHPSSEMEDDDASTVPNNNNNNNEPKVIVQAIKFQERALTAQSSITDPAGLEKSYPNTPEKELPPAPPPTHTFHKNLSSMIHQANDIIASSAQGQQQQSHKESLSPVVAVSTSSAVDATALTTTSGSSTSTNLNVIDSTTNREPTSNGSSANNNDCDSTLVVHDVVHRLSPTCANEHIPSTIASSPDSLAANDVKPKGNSASVAIVPETLAPPNRPADMSVSAAVKPKVTRLEAYPTEIDAAAVAQNVIVQCKTAFVSRSNGVMDENKTSILLAQREPPHQIVSKSPSTATTSVTTGGTGKPVVLQQGSCQNVASSSLVTHRNTGTKRRRPTGSRAAATAGPAGGVGPSNKLARTTTVSSVGIQASSPAIITAAQQQQQQQQLIMTSVPSSTAVLSTNMVSATPVALLPGNTLDAVAHGGGGVVTTSTLPHQTGHKLVMLPSVNGMTGTSVRLPKGNISTAAPLAPTDQLVEFSPATMHHDAGLVAVNHNGELILIEGGGSDHNVISIPEDGRKSADIEALCSEVVGGGEAGEHATEFAYITNAKGGDELSIVSHPNLFLNSGGGNYVLKTGSNAATGIQYVLPNGQPIDIGGNNFIGQQQILVNGGHLDAAGSGVVAAASSGTTSNLLAAAISGGFSHGDTIGLSTSSGIVPIRIVGSHGGATQLVSTSAVNHHPGMTSTTTTTNSAGSQHFVQASWGAPPSTTGKPEMAPATARAEPIRLHLKTAAADGPPAQPPRASQHQMLSGRPPRTEVLLQTAKEVLQLRDDEVPPPRGVSAIAHNVVPASVVTNPAPIRRVYMTNEGGDPLMMTEEPDCILPTVDGGEQVAHRISIADEDVGQVEVADDNGGTYIIQPVNGEDYYTEDPNIMWIEETVESVENVQVEQESYEAMPSMVIILNNNGTINEEMMLANGIDLDTIRVINESTAGGVSLQPVVSSSTVTTSSSSLSPIMATSQALPPQTSHLAAQTVPQQVSLVSQPAAIAAPNSGHHVSITSLQHPIPKKLLTGVQQLTAQPPRTVLETASGIPQATIARPSTAPVPIRLINGTPRTAEPAVASLSGSVATVPAVVKTESASSPEDMLHSLQAANIKTEASRAAGPTVVIDSKDDMLVVDEMKPIVTAQHQIININGTNHLIATSNKPMPGLKPISSSQAVTTLPMTSLGLDLSLPKKSNPLSEYLTSDRLVSDGTVLKVIGRDDFMKRLQQNTKVRRPRPKTAVKDENSRAFVPRKTTSLGALGQALHGSAMGIPRDCRENALQICPLCKFQATTKNPYRHLQDHLARVHFKDRIAAELPTKKPYICPMEGCDEKAYPDWQAVMRHFIGKKHGILDKYVKEELAQVSIDESGNWNSCQT